MVIFPPIFNNLFKRIFCKFFELSRNSFLNQVPISCMELCLDFSAVIVLKFQLEFNFVARSIVRQVVEPVDVTFTPAGNWKLALDSK